MTLKAKWVLGNEKLLKTSGGKYRVVGFGIPADMSFVDTTSGRPVERNTCPQAGACKAVCYAKQGRYAMSHVANARYHNLVVSQTASFVADMISDLRNLTVKSKYRRKPYNVVRLHDSGDFYSQQYLDNWAAIARALPDVTFYAYTKSHTFSYENIPSNLRIVRSQGGKRDNLINIGLPHSRIFSTHEDRINAGYVDGNVSDIPAIEGDTRIGLVYHGNKKLTKAQAKFFQ